MIDNYDDLVDWTSDPAHPVYEGIGPVRWYKRKHAELFLPLETLRLRRHPWPSIELGGCGVYFLWDNDDLIYVGQSGDIWIRLRAHEKDKYLTHASQVLCPQLTLNRLEREYIAALAPPLNIRWHPRRFYPL